VGREDRTDTTPSGFRVIRIVRNHEELAESVWLRTAEKFKRFNVHVHVDTPMILGPLPARLELEFDGAQRVHVCESARDVDKLRFTLDALAARLEIDKKYVSAIRTVQGAHRRDDVGKVVLKRGLGGETVAAGYELRNEYSPRNAQNFEEPLGMIQRNSLRTGRSGSFEVAHCSSISRCETSARMAARGIAMVGSAS
jgi:hypothetical protein